MARSPAWQSIEILLWMTLPVVGGYFLWRAWLRHGSEERTSAIARTCGKLAIGGTASFLMAIVFWKAALPVGEAVAFPLVGLSAHVVGAATAWLGARGRGLNPSRQAACLLGGGQTNLLTFGGITIVLLLGTAEDPGAERPLQLLALLRILEGPFYFLALWPMAAWIAQTGAARERWGATFRKAFQPVTLLPLAGIAGGLGLNVAGIPRPAAFDGVAAILVRANVVLMGITVGMALRHARPFKNFRYGLFLSAIKFVIVPASTVTLAWLLGYRGLALQVALICSSMPVAFMAVLGSTLLRIDEETVGSVWLFTTTGVFVVVPWLALAVPIVGRL